MEKLKRVVDLQQGDKIKGRNGECIEIISNNENVLFFYNTRKAIFETLILTKRQKEQGQVVLF